MYDTAFMGCMNGPGQRSHQVRSLLRRHRSAGKPLFKTTSLNELHRDAGCPFDFQHVINVDDVGMLYASERLPTRLPPKSRQSLGTQMNPRQDHL